MAGGGGGGIQEGIAAQPDDSSLNCASVDSREGRSIGVWVDYPLVSEENGQGGPTRRLKGSLHAAGAGVSGHQPVRGVVRLQGSILYSLKLCNSRGGGIGGPDWGGVGEDGFD